MSNLIRFSGAPRRTLFFIMEEVDQVRLAFGQRLAAARALKGYTQEEIARRFGVGKGAVSAWEKGRGDPGVFKLRQLSKLYEVSADALLWDSAPSVEAMQMAAQFDALNEKQRATLKAVWMAYVEQAAQDAEIEAKMPITRKERERS